MSWRVVAAAAAGTAHAVSSRSCEDRCRARVQSAVDGVPVLSIFVADGAGSAAFGAQGAALAVAAPAALLARRLRQPGFLPTAALAVDVLRRIRAYIDAAARSRGRLPRDFACTFVGVVSTPAATLVVQIGDGGVVLDTGAGLELPIAPMGGEYANTTHFVTDADAVERLQTRIYAGPAARVAAFSDGLQRLALDLAGGTPHRPLFDRLFGVIAAAGAAQAPGLHEALLRLLTSDGVNARTDDDKTLALAVRMQ